LTASNSKALGFLYVAVAATIWGSNGVIVNWVPFNAYVIAFFRVVFASLTLLPIVLLTQRHEMVRVARAWRSMLALGLLLSLGWGFLFHSMKLIAIANAVLLNYMAPIFVALLAPVFLKEKIERTTIFALATSMVGMIMISSQQNLQASDLNLLGVVFGLLAGLAYAGFIILSKRAVAGFSSQVVAFYAYSATIVFLSPSLVGVNLALDIASWMLLLVLGVFNTGFAVTLYLKGLRLVKAQKAVVFTYLEPASAVAFGFLFLAQQPTLLMLIGGFLILVAGYTVASK
jgi:drug/metabolite transporter (DMT)-like permease